MTDLTAWLISAGILLAGCWLQSVVGFGMAIVSAPVIVLIRPEWVPYTLVATALPLCLINMWNQRRGLRPRTMLVPMVTRIPGTLFGVWLLTMINTMWLQVTVAVSVFLGVLASIRVVYFEATPARLGWAGLIGGFMGTTTSIGGPPMALVMQHGDPLAVRANLSMFFAYGVFVSLLGYAAMGMLTVEILLISASFLPLPFIGFALGVRTRRYLDERRFRHVLLWICTLAALTALLGAVFEAPGMRD